jgi:hypothetical protein
MKQDDKGVDSCNSAISFLLKLTLEVAGEGASNASENYRPREWRKPMKTQTEFQETE